MITGRNRSWLFRQYEINNMDYTVKAVKKPSHKSTLRHEEKMQQSNARLQVAMLMQQVWGEYIAANESRYKDYSAEVSAQSTPAPNKLEAIAKIASLEDQIRFERIAPDHSYRAERIRRCRQAEAQRATKVHQKILKKTHLKKGHMRGIFEAAAVSAQAQYRKCFSILDLTFILLDTDITPKTIAPHLNTKHLPPYRELPDNLLPTIYNLALNEKQGSGLQPFPFSFNLSKQVINNPKFKANPAGYLQDLILKNLKRKISGDEFYFWFTLESNSLFGDPNIRPHIHGAILLTRRQLRAARKAFHTINGIQKKVAAIKKFSRKSNIPLSETTISAGDFVKREIQFSQIEWLEYIKSSGDVYTALNWGLYTTKHWVSDKLQWLGNKAHCAASEPLKRASRDFYERLRLEVNSAGISSAGNTLH